jgi:hypothetical protein
MIESEVRELFTEIARGEPHSSRVNVQLAQRRGRARLRWRRACLGGTAVLAAAAISVGANAAWSSSGTGDSGLPPASAPLQFNPLVPYLSFGWLPAGNRVLDGDLTPQADGLNAGHKIDSSYAWGLVVYAAGQCHFTGLGGELKCSTPALEGFSAQITGRAPAVRGHRAYWAGSYLVWQYTRDGWAWLAVPTVPGNGPQSVSPAAQRDAVKIAANVRYGAPTPPLMFPMQLKGVPGKWRVGSVYYQPDGRVMRTSRFALTTGHPQSADGGLQFQNGLPNFPDIEPAASHGNYCGQPPNRIINGYHVLLGNGYLCAAHADGLEFSLGQQGAHPPISLASLFGHHLRLLGTNPANWTRKPIG